MHSEICNELTFNQKCPCKIYELEKLISFEEINLEHDRLLSQSEKYKSKDFDKGTERIKFMRQRAGMTSKIRILKKWMDDNRK
jgi:hypothetical protein